jgi:hypothetical protein
MVLRENGTAPVFLEKSTGGWFKGKDPSMSSDLLRARWLSDASIVYIGKAASAKGLQGRLKQYLDFGEGKAIGHRGGRLIWQIEEAAKLVIAWRLVQEGQSARELEAKLLLEFEHVYGRLPFANLSH